MNVPTLRAEPTSIAGGIRSVESGLAAVDAHLAEWEEVLSLAMRFATNCAHAYRRASEKTRRLFNQAVFRGDRGV